MYLGDGKGKKGENMTGLEEIVAEVERWEAELKDLLRIGEALRDISAVNDEPISDEEIEEEMALESERELEAIMREGVTR